MTFITLLAALYAQWFMGLRVTLSDYDWFTPYITFLGKYLDKSGLLQGYVGLALVVLPIVLAVSMVGMLVDDWAFHLFELAFGLLVCFYCFDAVNPEEALDDYFRGKKADQEVQAYLGEALPKTDGGIARKVSNTLFTRSLHDIFAVMFWFALLGPCGAVAYFMVALVGLGSCAETKPMVDAARMVQAVLEWVPVRLVGLSFALVGNFGEVFVYWVKHVVTGLEHVRDLMTHYGLLALGANPRESKASDHQEAYEASQLVYRAVIVWLVLIGVMTLASWF